MDVGRNRYQRSNARVRGRAVEPFVAASIQVSERSSKFVQNLYIGSMPASAMRSAVDGTDSGSNVAGLERELVLEPFHRRARPHQRFEDRLPVLLSSTTRIDSARFVSRSVLTSRIDLVEVGDAEEVAGDADRPAEAASARPRRAARSTRCSRRSGPQISQSREQPGRVAADAAGDLGVGREVAHGRYRLSGRELGRRRRGRARAACGRARASRRCTR